MTDEGEKSMRKIGKKLKVHHLVAYMLVIAMVSGYVPQGICLKEFNIFKNIGQVQAATTLQNPRIVKDSSMRAGQRVTWDCVWFGSYPQNEVVEKGGKEEVALRKMKETDGEIQYNSVSSEEFQKIVNASYDENGDAIINGEKYRRVRKEDTTYYSKTSEEGYYNWKLNTDTYRYFKYEPIRWRVLKVDNDEALLLADSVLDDQKYNLNYTGISLVWERSSVRSWLNGYNELVNQPEMNYTSKNFINTAFSYRERCAIEKKNLENKNSIVHGTDGGNDTCDKVFLLAESEACYTKEAQSYGFIKSDQYDEARHSKCSNYAYAMGTRRSFDKEYKGNCCWWFRSPGSQYVNSAANVWSDGLCGGDGLPIDYSFVGVRPALYLNLATVNTYSYAGTVGSDKTNTQIEEDRTGDLDDNVDYRNEIANFMKNKGTLNTIKYLCRNENFTNSIYVHENDGTFASNISMVLSDTIYRGMDGWRDLFSASTSEEEAEKIIAALLETYEKDVEALSKAKNAKKYAGYFVNGLEDYLKIDSVTNGLNKKDIENLKSIVTEKKIEELLCNGKYQTLSAYFQVKGGYSADSAIVKKLDEYTHSASLAKELSGGLKFLGKGLTFLSITKDTFDYVYQLESLQDADEIYSEMLLYLKENCAYDVIKKAANNLYQTIHGTYMDELNGVKTKIKNKVEDKVVELCIESACKAIPYSKIIKKGYDWGVNLSNVFFHTEDIQKEKDKMRIIAYLGNSLSSWVIKNQSEFLQLYSEGTESEQNVAARKLYYSLYMLWNTRRKGEEVLQKMLQKSYTKWSKYYTMSLQISATLDSAKDVMFTSNMISTFVTVTVACPVDVEVYDSEKQLLTVKDGQESSGYENGIYYYVKYQELDKDYIKFICYPQDENYNLNYVGKDIGRVDSDISQMKEDGTLNRQKFENVCVNKGDCIKIKADKEGNYEYSKVDVVSGEEKKQLFQKDAEEYIAIANIKLENEELKLKPEERKLLVASIIPENATEQKMEWTSSNEEIVEVNSDGVITAKKEGEAVVTVLALFDKTFTRCNVKVEGDTIQKEDKESEKNKENLVNKMYVSTIRLLGLSKQIAAGKKLKLTAAILPETATNKKILWKSSNPKAATVTQTGVVTLKKKSGGKKAVITAAATDGSGAKASWKVTSMKGIVKKVKLTGNKPIKAGKSVKLKAKVKATKKANKKLLWTSSNTKYATVNAKGVVKTKKAGKRKKVKITAMATDGSGKKATVTIKIK